MNRLIKLASNVAVLIALSPLPVLADETVRWSGTVSDAPSSHNTDHKHALVFTRSDTGESYNIVDSPKLNSIHCSQEAELLVSIQGKRTSDYVLWGNNLVVDSFTLLPQAEAKRTPHLASLPTPSQNYRWGYMK